LFVAFAHDLKPVNTLNYLLKYADDALLLSPHISPPPVELEMAGVMDWARERNVYKPAEDCGIVFRGPNISECMMQSCSESTLDMILISRSMLSLLLLFVIKDFVGTT